MDKKDLEFGISKVESFYKFLRALIFDNLLVILVFYFVYVRYSFTTTNKFNYWIILWSVLLFIAFFLLKYIYRRYTTFGSMVRANQCLELTTNIIIDRVSKPIESRRDIINRPLKDFIINSSHNTYVPCNQNLDIASPEAIKRALAMGARVIELDVFARNNTGTSLEDYEPVVAHGVERGSGRDIFTTSYITFEECIDTIAKYGFNTSDPLILCIENNTNNLIPTQRRMAEIIRNKLGNRLLNDEFKLSKGPNRKYFINESINNLLNKLIIISGGGNKEPMREILDGIFYENNILGNAGHVSALSHNENKEIIKRIYPAGTVGGNFSYNFDPVPYWKKGFQIVALNFNNVDSNLLKNFNVFTNYNFILKDELKL